MGKKIKTQDSPTPAPTVSDTLKTLPKGDGTKTVETAKVVLAPKVEAAIKDIPKPVTNKKTFVVGENGQPKHIWIQAPKLDDDDVRVDLLKIKLGCKTQKDLGRAILDLAYKTVGI